MTLSIIPQGALTPKLRNSALLVFSQTVCRVYCYIHSQHSDVWAKITDDHVDESGAVTISFTSVTVGMANHTSQSASSSLSQINSWTHA